MNIFLAYLLMPYQRQHSTNSTAQIMRSGTRDLCSPTFMLSLGIHKMVINLEAAANFKFEHSMSITHNPLKCRQIQSHVAV